MYRGLKTLGSFCFGGLIPLKSNTDDNTYISKYGTSGYEEFNSYESGKERIRQMFSVDAHKNVSKEATSVLQSIFVGTFVGACYGGFVKSRVSYFDFIDNNQATSFYSNFEAKKKLQHQVTMGFARGALQWGWRLGLFVGTYTFLTTTISVYRGKSSMVEYLTAGAVAGSLYKLNHGLRGVIVGGGLGLILGCVGGAASLTILQFTGKNMDEVRYWQHQWRDSRHKGFEKAIERDATEKHSLLTVTHDLKLQESNDGPQQPGLSSTKEI